MNGSASAPSGYDLAVFVGRFQPFHNGHLHVVREGLARAGRLLIVLGSAEAARRPDLIPFTADERREMIEASLTPEERSRVAFATVPDYGDLGQWIAAVEQAALATLGGDGAARITLVGCSKDRSSYYLDFFPAWDAISVAPQLGGLSATPLREAFFDADEGAVDALLAGPAAQALPAAVVDWLAAFRKTAAYRDLVEEWAFARRYRAAWSVAPYPPVFVTADAVVIHAGRVLLIRRKAWPGRGLWALPGGFVEQDEPVLDAAVRELTEETGLALTPAQVRASLSASRVCDAPRRDIRGRVISHAALFQLPGSGAPPSVAAADDAAEVRWVPLADLRRETMYGDHFQIVANLTRAAGEET